MSYTIEKRQFGRRRSEIRGAAIVAKEQPKPFTICDLSEGGALLAFDDPAIVPERSFRITIDGTAMVLLCEVRHRGKAGVGVRFMRPSEGIELKSHFLSKPNDVCVAASAEVPRRAQPAAPPVRGQDLRASLQIVHSAAEIATEAIGAEARRAVHSPLAARLLRFRNAIIRQRGMRPDDAASLQQSDDYAPRR